jgi:hypothetical protein
MRQRLGGVTAAGITSAHPLLVAPEYAVHPPEQAAVVSGTIHHWVTPQSGVESLTLTPIANEFLNRPAMIG